MGRRSNALDELRQIAKPKKKAYGSRDTMVLLQKDVPDDGESSEDLNVGLQKEEKVQENDDSVVFMDEVESTVVFDADNSEEVLFADDDTILPDDNIQSVQSKSRIEQLKRGIAPFPLSKEARDVRSQYIGYLYGEYKSSLLGGFNGMLDELEDHISDCVGSIHSQYVNVFMVVGMNKYNYDYQNAVKETMCQFGCTWDQLELDSTTTDRNNVVLIVEVGSTEDHIEMLWRILEGERRGLLVLLVGNTVEECEHYLLGNHFPIHRVGSYSINTVALVRDFECVMLERTIKMKLPIIHPSVVINSIEYYRDFHHSYLLFVDFFLRHIENAVVFSSPSLVIPQFTEHLVDNSASLLVSVKETYSVLSVLFSRLLLSVQALTKIQFKEDRGPYTSLLKVMDLNQPLKSFTCPTHPKPIEHDELEEAELSTIITTFNSDPSPSTYNALVRYVCETIGGVKTFQLAYPEKVNSCCVSVVIDFESYSYFEIIRHCEDSRDVQSRSFEDYRTVLEHVNNKGIITLPQVLELFKDEGQEYVKHLLRQLVTFGLFIPHNDQLRSTELTIPFNKLDKRT